MACCVAREGALRHLCGSRGSTREESARLATRSASRCLKDLYQVLTIEHRRQQLSAATFRCNYFSAGPCSALATNRGRFDAHVLRPRDGGVVALPQSSYDSTTVPWLTHWRAVLTVRAIVPLIGGVAPAFGHIAWIADSRRPRSHGWWSALPSARPLRFTSPRSLCLPQSPYPVILRRPSHGWSVP